MIFPSSVAKAYAKRIVANNYGHHQQAQKIQEHILNANIEMAQNSLFGKQHQFHLLKTSPDFVNAVPVRTYEEMEAYIARVKNGDENILWPGKPIYFAKTSGTTSGAKFIPITKESIGHHITTARNALLHYINRTGNSSFTKGKMIFLQGSPGLEKINGIAHGRLSGIAYHHVPAYLHANRLPSYKTNCIEDWEQKVEAIARECIGKDLRLISGIPPWLTMFFEKLILLSGKTCVIDIFPNLQLLVYGGVNYAPYKNQIETLIGKEVDTIETFPASEGFFAFSDLDIDAGMLLNVDAGMFYEFREAGKDTQRTLQLCHVAQNTNYELIISSNAGLWRYATGDVVRFVSIQPYRIKFAGRTKQFLSAFGEHVIAEEVERAMLRASGKQSASVTEFMVVPHFGGNGSLPAHQWLVEFLSPPDDITSFAQVLDAHMQEQNIYYRDLRKGNVLATLMLHVLPCGSFLNFARHKQMLGGQNKIQRLNNNRQLADELLAYTAIG